jgi:hypothetical protein
MTLAVQAERTLLWEVRLMRRLFADRLVIATAVAVILMSLLFAYERVAG